MNILLVGGGGREHALAWKIRQSPLLSRLVCAPGNPGIARLCEVRAIDTADIEGLIGLAVELKAGLVVIGPETSLALGLADRLAELEIPCFGPTTQAAELETSKAFAKAFAERHGLPSGRYEVFETATAAKMALSRFDPPWVIKADGLAAGKGVTVSPDRTIAEQAIDEIFDGRLGAQSGRVIIDEFIEGEIASVFALCDGETFMMFGSAQDHKRAFDHDRGPNTGGMGAYAPAPLLTEAMLSAVRDQLIGPTLMGIAAEGAPFRGVLFCEVMVTRAGPKLIEFNARFGDPECQVLMMRLQSDVIPYLQAAASGRLTNLTAPVWSNDAAVCVVLAANGYPGAPETGSIIANADRNFGPDTIVFHAATAIEEGDTLVAAGGRVLNVCSRAPTVSAAAKRAYEIIDVIEFPGSFHRRDIGWRAREAEGELAPATTSG